jgi:hypothetical protein
VRRPWRWAFVSYAFALTVATHWPRLKLPPEAPSDKSIHLFAFAGLTFLLWHTQWLRGRWVVMLLAAAWACIDEVSQALPGLGRTVSIDDAKANLLGVLCSSAMLYAVSPVGGAANRLRLAMHAYIFESVFARWEPWIVMAALAAGCALPVLIVWRTLEPTGLSGPILIALAVWLMASWMFLRSWWRSELARVREQQPCFECGDTSQRALDQLGMTTCPTCGRTLYAAQWREPAPPGGGELSRMGVLPVVIGVGVLLCLFGAIAAFAIVSGVSLTDSPMQRFLPHVVRTIGGSPTLAHMLDLTGCVLLFAALARLYRARLAHHYDQANRCRKCGHDLRGTPTAGGRGICGECGTEFFTAVSEEKNEPQRTRESTESAEGEKSEVRGLKSDVRDQK